MSQRGRPGSAQSPSNQQRMPIEAAEALLWGRETHNEHVHLYGRMRELEEQHRDYDSRIQATETIAEAAEAATERMRRVEQQVVAIESDEQDRPFDKWAEGEISGFKNFIESNKNVRQKQIELEEKLSRIEDSVDKAKDASEDVKTLLERVARLESNHVSDANRIRKLETDVTILTLQRSNWSVKDNRTPAQTSRRQTPKQMMPPPPRQPQAQAQDESETEDENNDIAGSFTTMQLEQEQIQVPQSPDVKAQSSSSVFGPGSSSIKGGSGMPAASDGRGEKSARARMMQRKSIHEPKKSRAPTPGPRSRSRPQPSQLPPTQIVGRHDFGTSAFPQDAPLQTPQYVSSIQSGVPDSRSVLQSHIRADPLPPTQIVSKPSTKKSAYAQDVPLQTTDPASYTKSRAPAPDTKSRSRIQMKPVLKIPVVGGPSTRFPAHSKEAASLTPGLEDPKQLMVTLPTRKRKLGDNESNSRLTRSQAKKSQDTGQLKLHEPTVGTQIIKKPAAKRRKADSNRAPQQSRSMAPESEGTNDNTKVFPNTANLVETSPHKAAVTTKSQRCNPCTKAHTSCDQARPVCGNCQKRPQRGACVYVNPPANQSQSTTRMTASSRKQKAAKPSVLHKVESLTKAGGEPGFHHDDNRAISKTVGAGRPTSPVRSSMARETPHVAPRAGTSATPGSMRPPPSSARSIMPSFDDYKDLL